MYIAGVPLGLYLSPIMTPSHEKIAIYPYDNPLVYLLQILRSKT